ncbi:MAG: DMT family transporter [Anaerolineales bacterium]|nr:DMT family transporter [Anaerolineales bacterium]
MRSDSNRNGLLAGLAAAAIWGGMYAVSKVVLEVIPPFTLLSLRLLLGAAALGAWMLWRRQPLRLARGEWLQLLLLGVLGYGLSLGLQFSGTQLSTAANGAVITAATPVFIYLFARPLLGERVTRLRWLALLVSSLGVLAVVDPRQAQLDAQLWQGNLLLVGAAVTWALYSVLVRRASRATGALRLSFVAFLGGMLWALPAAALELQQQTIGALTPGLVAGILYLGVVSTAVAAYLWNLAFETLQAGLASLTFFAQPLVGSLLGILLLGEPASWAFVAGGALILLGLWMAAREDRIGASL